MNVITFPLGELQANCYFLRSDKECLIVDPGDSADFILEEVSRNNLEVNAIIATHGHFDHVMAIGELQLSLKCPVYISSDDQFLLKRVEETARHFLGHVPEVLPIRGTSDLTEGLLQVSNFKFRTISTPGHTPGSICLYFEDESALFTGDTLFKDGIGRYDFSYSDKKLLISSLRGLMKDLPEDTIIYPGHGDPSTLGVEANNLRNFL